MRRHVLTHVADKPYKCNLCKHSYIQRSQLLRHIDTHTGFVCFHCELRFPNKARLLIHNRKHKETKLFCPYHECEHAKKEFNTESSYDEHLKTHSEDKKMFSCEVCRKQFMSEQNMRRHMSTHTLDKPRRCMYCVSARAYIRGMHLVRHVRHFHLDVFRAHLAHVRSVLKRVTKSELESILNVLDAEAERILEGCSDGPTESNPLMSEETLAEHLSKLLEQLVDAETLECLGWPDETVDVRLRENAKHLFIHVVDDKSVAKMLDTHTIDQIVKHILNQFTADTELRTEEITGI
ncbi:putative gonadotropin inducible transcription factor [Operophtera brumata]|uniref:Putative gonadotropin inducible transcription factor n=1 Tax=Operophtera brumata TaxID=104452 RepID=A0A0L7LFE5_OPEBR|nr:putative gonadotropin inducible transcription factor [Operophtera brumata]